MPKSKASKKSKSETAVKAHKRRNRSALDLARKSMGVKKKPKMKPIATLKKRKKK